MKHHHCIRDVQQMRRLVGALRSVHTVNWSTSPEGWDYWNERVQKLKDYLGEVPESFRANPSDLPELLICYMSWGSTDEGPDYWSEFYDTLDILAERTIRNRTSDERKLFTKMEFVI